MFAAVIVLLVVYFVLRGFSAHDSFDTSDHLISIVHSMGSVEPHRYSYHSFDTKTMKTEDRKTSVTSTAGERMDTQTPDTPSKYNRDHDSARGLKDEINIVASPFLKDSSILFTVRDSNFLPPSSNTGLNISSSFSPSTVASNAILGRSPDDDERNPAVSKLKNASPEKLQLWFRRSLNRTGTVQQNVGHEARYMVYYCGSRHRCGGWADRQRGLLSVFLLAIVTGRKFKIDMRSPCNITNFVVPVGEDWWTTEASATDSHALLDDMAEGIVGHVLRAGQDLNALFPHTVLQVRTNRDLAPFLLRHSLYRRLLPPWATSSSKRTRFRTGWRLLAAPSPTLFSRILTHLRPLWPDDSPPSSLDLDQLPFGGNVTLLCAHVRIGQNPTIPNDNVRNDVAVASVALDFLQENLFRVGQSAYVFVATDDQEVRVAARERFGARLIDHGGKIVHIDRQGEQMNACAGFESAVMDQLILSVCHVLVISRSGFSLHAAYLRQHHGGLFILQNGSVKEHTLDYES